MKRKWLAYAWPMGRDRRKANRLGYRDGYRKRFSSTRQFVNPLGHLVKWKF